MNIPAKLVHHILQIHPKAYGCDFVVGSTLTKNMCGLCDVSNRSCDMVHRVVTVRTSTWGVWFGFHVDEWSTVSLFLQIICPASDPETPLFFAKRSFFSSRAWNYGSGLQVCRQGKQWDLIDDYFHRLYWWNAEISSVYFRLSSSKAAPAEHATCCRLLCWRAVLFQGTPALCPRTFAQDGPSVGRDLGWIHCTCRGIFLGAAARQAVPACVAPCWMEGVRQDLRWRWAVFENLEFKSIQNL